MDEQNPPTPKTKRRILAMQPLPCGPQWGSWYRDLGLIVRTLREQGHDAWLVLFYNGKETPNADEPVIISTMEKLEDPAWWKAQAPDGVILNLAGASRWEGIRAAAKQATPHLVEKLDTSGTFTPAIWFRRYFYEAYFHARDGGQSVVYAAAKIFSRSVILRMLPGLLDKKRVRCLAGMPVLVAESPIATERTKLYMRTFGGRGDGVVCIPHPVDETGLVTQGDVVRKNRIVSVGRWDSRQKNFPLLMEVLGRFLKAYPAWSADIIGRLPADAEERLRSLPGAAAARITLTGPVPHDQLAEHYRAAKIFFMSSRHESFNIAAAESLCCGCSVVGWDEISSVPFFTGRNSGTPTSRYSAEGFMDALEREAAAWRDGKRDAAAISVDWVKITGAQAVTRRMLEVLEFPD